jgi:hypothetical protein
MKRSLDGIQSPTGADQKNAAADYKRTLERCVFVEADVWRHEKAGLV